MLSLAAALVGSGVLCSSSMAAEAPCVLLPALVKLAGSEARQTLVLERQQAGKFVGQQVEGVRYESSDQKIVVIENGIARPVANGRATITAHFAGGAASATAAVTGMERPFEWSFRNHVESVLAKAGCSSGACHGAQAGKNGFKISLFGYDPEGDFLAITRSARGRRIVLSDPGRSLFLTKPTGAIAHKGGVRFKADSHEYRVLADWIAAGVPQPQAADSRVVRLEILPPGVVLQPGAKQQLLLLAHFNDGHVEDVTRWGRYTSTNSSVAAIGDQGQLTVSGYGEGAITGWYLSKVVVASVTSPYKQQVPPAVFAKAAKRNFIDELVLEKLESLNLPPSPPASDEEFIRRATIDTIGVLPTADETRRYLADRTADKRDRLIEALLARSEFVDYWAYKWSDLLLVNGEKLKSGTDTGSAMWSYYRWIRNHVEAGTPWDVMVRELITAKGSTLENGGANFFVLHKDPLDLAETTTVAFLGMSINCARCHNHPLEKWTNNQYYAMSNLYARVRTKTGTTPGSQIVFTSADGELVQPLTGKPQPPTPLDGEALAFDSSVDRREHLARWLTSPENPYFARSITNRVWANFMGVGLVEFVDDMRLTNPASNDKLLAALARHLVEHHFELKDLMRTILQSSTYQRSSLPLPGNAQDRRFYSRYYPRRLMAEVLLDGLSQVSGSPTQFGGYPTGWRAMELPDSMVNSYFLETFGRPGREVTCDCERTAEPSMVQVLHISNGTGLNGKLEAKGNQIDRWLAAKTPPEQVLDELYLSALSRLPRAKERAALLEALKAPGEPRQALEDVSWSVLSSKEFLFNH